MPVEMGIIVVPSNQITRRRNIQSA